MVRKRRRCEDVPATAPAEDYGDLDLGGSSGNDRKWLDSGSILKGGLTDFAGNSWWGERETEV